MIGFYIEHCNLQGYSFSESLFYYIFSRGNMTAKKNK